MACNDCPELNPNPNEGCLQPINSSCVTYDGNDVDCADIASGQTISQVIETLANNDCGLQEQIEDIVDNMEELSGNVNNLQDDLEELSGSVQTQIDNIITFTCQDLSGCSIDNLLDVDVSPVSGDNLVFNGIKWINYTPEDITPYQFTCEELSGCTMDELSGVNLTTPMSGDVLIHDGNAFINYPFSLLLSDLQNSINILNSQISFQSNLINLLHLRMDDCSCPTGATLDVDFSGCTIDICFQDSSPGKLFGSLHLAGSGTDFDSFDGVTMATIYVSDSANPSNTTKVVGYVPPETGLDVTYNIQLLSGMGNPIDTPVGLNTRTITFVVRFYDTNSILHFLSITANIPQLNNTDCSLNTSISYTLDDF